MGERIRNCDSDIVQYVFLWRDHAGPTQQTQQEAQSTKALPTK